MYIQQNMLLAQSMNAHFSETWGECDPKKLPKNVGDLGKLVVAKGLKSCPKCKNAQSGHTLWGPQNRRNQPNHLLTSRHRTLLGRKLSPFSLAYTKIMQT